MPIAGQPKSSESDLPSVSMLGENANIQNASQFVRSRKSHENEIEIGSTHEENLASVILSHNNLVSSNKTSSRVVRSRNSSKSKNDVEFTDKESFPSVSLLSSGKRKARKRKSQENNDVTDFIEYVNSPKVSKPSSRKTAGQHVRSPTLMQNEDYATNKDENVLNSSKTTADKIESKEDEEINGKKSNQAATPEIPQTIYDNAINAETECESTQPSVSTVVTLKSARNFFGFNSTSYKAANDKFCAYRICVKNLQVTKANNLPKAMEEDNQSKQTKNANKSINLIFFRFSSNLFYF